MFEKLQEYDFNGLHCSFYKNDVKDWIEFCNLILDNGYDIASLEAEDTLGDVGMKYGSGKSYNTLEEFEKHYSEFRKYCDTMRINLKYAFTSIAVKDFDDIEMTSADRDLDLNDLVAQKKMK